MNFNHFLSRIPCWLLALLPGAAAAAGLTVDTGQREAVRNVYNALYFASENVDMGWTGGSIAACSPGATSASYKDATLLRVNLFRALAGVPAGVTLHDAYNAKAQQAALMMSANNKLSHTPAQDQPSWPCLTSDGNEAAGNSNLALSSSGPAAITGYLWDLGSNNYPVGHRRWMFYPQVQKMGAGDVAGDGQHPSANALWYFDSVFNSADPTKNPRPAVRDDFVAWPPPGYVPYYLVSPRWSLSYPKADFRQATVTMSHNGANVPVALEPLVPDFGGNGFIGENTRVWRPTDASLGEPTPVPAKDETFAVSVQNVIVNGQAKRFDYTVTLFDPTLAGGDTVLPSIRGCDAARRDEGNLYAIQGQIPAADGLEWLSGRTIAFATVQNAENGLGDLRADIGSSYDARTNETAAGGSWAYRLQDAALKGQTLTVEKLLIPGPAGVMSFDSRLGWASGSEAAVVQISVDGGHSWRDIYTQKGTDSAGESAFVLRSLPLAEFRARPVIVRFRFDVLDRRSFKTYNPGPGVGWYLDNIAFTDVAAVNAPVIAPAQSGGSLLFKPSATGAFALAARGTVQGHPLEWGPARPVNVVAGSGNLAPVADGGADLSILVGTAVTLDGRNSHDPDSCSAPGVIFAWTQTAGPPVTLAGADTAQPGFTPTVAGTYVFTLKVSDGALESTDTVTVAVREPSPLRLLYPNGGETFKVRTKQTILWESTGLAPKAKVKLQLQFTNARGRNKLVTLAASTKNVGRYVWKPTRAQVSATAILQVCGPKTLPAAKRCDKSDGTFSIQR